MIDLAKPRDRGEKFFIKFPSPPDRPEHGNRVPARTDGEEPACGGTVRQPSSQSLASLVACLGDQRAEQSRRALLVVTGNGAIHDPALRAWRSQPYVTQPSAVRRFQPEIFVVGRLTERDFPVGP